MNVLSKARDKITSRMQDEVIRKVDPDRSELPDWVQEDDEATATKRPQKSKPAKKPQKKKPQSQKGAPPVKKGPPPAIASFETWSSDAFEDAPRQVDVDSENDFSFPEDDSEGPSLPQRTSLETQEDEDTWNPLAEESTGGDPGMTDYAAGGYDPEGPQLTDAHGYLSEDPEDWARIYAGTEAEDDESYDALDAEVASSKTESEELVIPEPPADRPTISSPPSALPDYDESAPTERQEPEMASELPDELSEPLVEDPDEILASYAANSDALKDVVSLKTLDATTFPQEDHGYNVGSVDATMAYLRLSLSHYMNYITQSDEALKAISEELAERNSEYNALDRASRERVAREDFDSLESQNEALTRTVTDLARRLGLNPSDFLGDSEEESNELVFHSFGRPQSSEPTEPEDEEEPPAEPPAEEEALGWGKLR